MSVVLAHLIPAPFTQQAARGLLEADLLDQFCCTLVDEPSANWQTMAKQVAKLGKYDLGRDLKRRAVTEVPMEKVKSYPVQEVLRMIGTRLVKDPVVTDRVFHWARDGFDEWVGRQLEASDGIRAVYGYEYGCKRTFETAQRLGLKRIYDLPSPEHDFVERLLGPEFERFPELQTAYRGRVLAKQEERTDRRRREWELTDLVVANSRFTGDSWQGAGWSRKQVAVVPYGAPPVWEKPKTFSESGPVRALWAGSFSVRKGGHYLLEALQKLDPSGKFITVDVYGAVTLPQALLDRAPASLKFRGSVPRAELFEFMRTSDALVFPTLCDGFGLVVNEAFAQGLPVLTTTRAGAADLVEDDTNGWLVEAGNSGALVDGLQRVLDDRSRLPEMGAAAKRTAADWQWSDYRRGIAKAVGELLEGDERKA